MEVFNVSVIQIYKQNHCSLAYNLIIMASLIVCLLISKEIDSPFIASSSTRTYSGTRMLKLSTESTLFSPTPDEEHDRVVKYGA